MKADLERIIRWEVGRCEKMEGRKGSVMGVVMDRN